MNMKILITGPPRSGKSTLILKLLGYFTQYNIPTSGFITPEVREYGKRIGFDIENISTKEKVKLAREGNFETRFKLGKYSVFKEEFETFIEDLFALEKKKRDLIIIDEIGKMELFSIKFQDIIRELFSSNLMIIATIGLTLKHPIKSYLLKIPEIQLFNLTRQNFQLIFEKIISFISLN